MPPGAPLDHRTVLAATEEILRRYGPAKATVVDVARELGVSHAAVYKYFPSKQALREAVTRRWLDQNRAVLAGVARDSTTRPPQRLRAWLQAVLALKREKSREDPQLFAAYGSLAALHSDVASEHVADLLHQLEEILAAGAADGSFACADPAGSARTVFDATSRFNHIAHAAEWQDPGIDARLDAVCTVLLEGLRTTTDHGGTKKR